MRPYGVAICIFLSFCFSRRVFEYFETLHRGSEVVKGGTIGEDARNSMLVLWDVAVSGDS